MDEVDALVNRVLATSSEEAPVLMQLYVASDVHTQELSAGVVGDRGVLRYAGRDWFEGVCSLGEGRGGGEPLLYFYMDSDTEFPSNAEVPLDVVRQAIKDYLVADGARPTCVSWQPDH
ncbi:hypothetical protein FHS29_006683 [Saccharothrix tamanrassetensis]|uniref:Immunity protein Imm1 n=1 Tax=Saccharothrix tamanrassetensis TaxID=1051531 RepID=A0A841CQR5_9PSEU|nr:hypothetical protein [Saccharothrix tamanrassetensis]